MRIFNKSKGGSIPAVLDPRFRTRFTSGCIVLRQTLMYHVTDESLMTQQAISNVWCQKIEYSEPVFCTSNTVKILPYQENLFPVFTVLGGTKH